MSLPSDFFETDFRNSDENESYNTCKALATSVKVVNDTSECGITFMKEYKKFHTKEREMNKNSTFYCYSSSCEANIQTKKSASYSYN